MQMWVVLILSHLVYALRERFATAADCDPFEVSVPRHGRPAAQAVQPLPALARTTRASRQSAGEARVRAHDSCRQSGPSQNSSVANGSHLIHFSFSSSQWPLAHDSLGKN